ncbi:hypothetical protein [Streptomyces endocoffeicus]|uniref:hypothetical protein n=1 Tax=Streptomyces endocoffeicus TaxID=2898945 RepID=UPI001E5A9A5B|nr:hypothetical protein [Streptomyces endocoffeicus]
MTDDEPVDLHPVQEAFGGRVVDHLAVPGDGLVPALVGRHHGVQAGRRDQQVGAGEGVMAGGVQDDQELFLGRDRLLCGDGAGVAVDRVPAGAPHRFTPKGRYCER